MNIEVRYLSRGGNTKRVAEAIAGAAGVTARDCSEPMTEPVDLLFLGSAVYAFGLDENMIAFIEGLDAGLVKRVALFGTSAMVKSGNKKMEELLSAKGIRAVSPDFYCRGEFSKVHKGRPNEADLERARGFATEIIKGLNT